MIASKNIKSLILLVINFLIGCLSITPQFLIANNSNQESILSVDTNKDNNLKNKGSSMDNISNNKILGTIIIIFGGVLFLIFAGPILFSLIIGFLGIILINYGLDLLGFEIQILSEIQKFIFNGSKFQVKTKSK